MKFRADRDYRAETMTLIVGVLRAGEAGSKGVMAQRFPSPVGTSLPGPQGRVSGR